MIQVVIEQSQPYMTYKEGFGTSQFFGVFRSRFSFQSDLTNNSLLLFINRWHSIGGNISEILNIIFGINNIVEIYWISWFCISKNCFYEGWNFIFSYFFTFLSSLSILGSEIFQPDYLLKFTFHVTSGLNDEKSLVALNLVNIEQEWFTFIHFYGWGTYTIGIHLDTSKILTLKTFQLGI